MTSQPTTPDPRGQRGTGPTSADPRDARLSEPTTSDPRDASLAQPTTADPRGPRESSDLAAPTRDGLGDQSDPLAGAGTDLDALDRDVPGQARAASAAEAAPAAPASGVPQQGDTADGPALRLRWWTIPWCLSIVWGVACLAMFLFQWEGVGYFAPIGALVVGVTWLIFLAMRPKR